MAGSKFLLTMNLTKQGQVRGSSTGKEGDLDFSKGMECHGFNYEAIAQFDAGSGQLVGRRRHSPITITREVDAASPKLLQALVTNEVFKAATLSFNAVDPGGKRNVVRKIELANGAVVAVRPAGSYDGRNREAVTLTYQDIAVDGLRNSFIPVSMLG